MSPARREAKSVLSIFCAINFKFAHSLVSSCFHDNFRLSCECFFCKGGGMGLCKGGGIGFCNGGGILRRGGGIL